MRQDIFLKIGIFFVSAFFLASLPCAAVGDDVGDNNIVIVLDGSGSMNELMSGTSIKKMDAAKSALSEVLKDVPEDTNIGLLVFSARNVRNDWVYPLGPFDDRKLKEAINRPMPSAGTPLGEYIKRGADRLLKKREEQYGYGTYRLLIVTDGEAHDRTKMEQFVPEVIARGITVDVIGVDMKSDHTLATKVHSYRRADDPATLKSAVAEVFAELSGTGSDAADAEAFAELAPIPDEMAVAMLKALVVSGNHSIGSKPNAQIETHSKKSTPQKVVTTKPVAKPQPAKQKPKKGLTVSPFIILAVIIFIVILISGKRKKR